MKVEQVHENKFEKERTTLRADEFGNVPGRGIGRGREGAPLADHAAKGQVLAAVEMGGYASTSSK